ncbi:FAD-dependent oxidoreductase [Micromonospora sp. NPDC047467]|uniref:NAD(P)/FAD-dependent oxidoreductase n=1 Tax=Micromonospora sp. NPDC047467 TaxID=3154814 RepID=UPI0033FDFC1C
MTASPDRPRRPASLWLDTLPAFLRARRPALSGDVQTDVVVIGAGFSGLWTAYYLTELAPQTSVLVVEAEHVAYGASGRNGGWCTTEMPALLANLVQRYGPMDAMRFYRAGQRTLDEIERVLAAEDIDCGWRRDGSLYVARTPPQVARLHAWQDMRLKLGITDMTLLSATETTERVGIEGALLSGFTPQCAAVQPAVIAAGLAQAVERRGVTVVEGTRVVGLRPGVVVTDRGTIRARSVLCTTEAYTAGLSGHARRVLPVISRVLATEPLSERRWREAGWRDRITVADSRYQFAYFQRTADDRLLVGGRGAGYHAGSRPDPAARSGDRVFARLRASLAESFPALADATVSHRWSGAYGMHRDGEPAVVYDRDSGLGHAGGYGGEGIALSNLAGRTLAALVAGVKRPETRLFWTGHRSRRWEPEPLRTIGVRTVSALATAADRYEDRLRRTAPLAGAVMRTVL